MLCSPRQGSWLATIIEFLLHKPLITISFSALPLFTPHSKNKQKLWRQTSAEKKCKRITMEGKRFASPYARSLSGPSKTIKNMEKALRALSEWHRWKSSTERRVSDMCGCVHVPIFTLGLCFENKNYGASVDIKRIKQNKRLMKCCLIKFRESKAKNPRLWLCVRSSLIDSLGTDFLESLVYTDS